MKRVAFVLPDLRGGGAEVVILRLLEALINDYSLYLFVGSLSGERLKQIPPNINVVSLNSSGINSVFLLYKNAKKYNLDAMIGTLSMAHAVSLTSLLLKGHKCKCIARVGNTISKDLDNFKGIKKQLMTLYQSVLTFADCTIVQSQFMYNDLVDIVKYNDKKKIQCIYNPLNQTKLKKLSLLESPVNNILSDDIVFVGRLCYQKDIMTTLKAFELYNLKFPSSTLHILGQGDKSHIITEFLERSTTCKNVIVHGFVDNPYSVIARSKCLLSSSLYEGFSNVVLEAISLEVPVVVSNCPGGNSEIVDDGINGFLFPVGNYKEAYEKLLDVNKIKCPGAMKEQFLFENVISKYKRVIDSEK